MAANFETYEHSYRCTVNGDGTFTVNGDDQNSYDIGDSGKDGSLSLHEGVTVGFGNPSVFSYLGLGDGHHGIFCDNGNPGRTARLFTHDVYASNAVITGVSEPVHTFCFSKGTRIRGAHGEQTVESLHIGDMLLNAAGEPVPVKWMGRQRRNPLFAALHQQLPIRISAGALGDGLPTRDLYVSPDHAMLVEGCLVHASALRNGRTIEQMTSWDGDVEYFHIETESHELIVAEGAATETFIDNVSRETFDNHAEYAALYPQAAPMVELDLPRICHARQLPRAISRKLDALADQLMGGLGIAA